MATNWLDSEDLQLCISYCRQTVDSIAGGKQKKGQLWSKIFADYHANWVMGVGETRTEPRTQVALSSRFGKLKPELKLWGSCLAYARRCPESGGNLQDEVSLFLFVGFLFCDIVI